MKNFLIDTDILIDYLRGVEKARDFLVKVKEKDRLLISIINVVEVYSGKDIRDSAKRKIIDEFLGGFEIIFLDEDLAKEAGKIRLNYQVPFADAIIAATAVASNLTLVTRNIKHFSKIKELKIKML